jgi:glutaredoxin
VGPTEHDASPRAVTIVTSTGCHLCERAKDVVETVALDHELEVRIVDLNSGEGRRLALLHRMPFPPMVLIDGAVHGHGRISEKRLRRDLTPESSAITRER